MPEAAHRVARARHFSLARSRTTIGVIGLEAAFINHHTAREFTALQGQVGALCRVAASVVPPDTAGGRLAGDIAPASAPRSIGCARVEPPDIDLGVVELAAITA
jgi:hypothetical protein